MRLRTARKLVAAVGTAREACYTPGQLRRARARVLRTPEGWWDALLRALGPQGRAEWLVTLGDVAGALRLLMDAPEGEWAGDPGAFRKGAGRA